MMKTLDQYSAARITAGQEIVETKEEEINRGKILCFVTGKPRKDTPEERVRQTIVRSLMEEYGYSKRDIELPFSIKMGSNRKEVDVAIFNKGSLHTQKNILLIVETKQEGIRPSDKEEGIEQLYSYISSCPNCKYGMWVGGERIAFQVIEKNGMKEFIPIPDIPKSGASTIPRPIRSELVKAVNLEQVFKRIHNYIYVNQGFQKDKAFEELLKLIFIKVFDEQYNSNLQFYMLPDEPSCDVRSRLSEIFENVKKNYRYIFRGNEKIELNDTILCYAVSEMQRFSFIDTDTDIKGKAYETIVGPNLRGDRGEFFTPRNVCNMVIDILFQLVPENTLIHPGSFKILDPAVGTGGFLIAGIQRIKRIFETNGIKNDRLRESVKGVAMSNFYGIDFNPFLVRVAQMNMVMHGDGSSNIEHENSLENPDNWMAETRDVIRPGTFDLVVTNPPFGTKSIIDDPNILNQFDLIKIEAKNKRTALPPEQLFIERCLFFLKPGGFLGIVVPDSILSNPGLVWIRKWILANARIIASIDLPTETFEPHTGTKTSVLILQKKTEVQKKVDEDYDVFMALTTKIGHDRRGNPLYRMSREGYLELDENKKPIIDDQLPQITQAFKEWQSTKLKTND